MKLRDYYRKNGFCKTKAIASVIGKLRLQNRVYLEQYIKCSDIDFEIPEESGIALMCLVNKQVKDSECPKNIRNKFYTYKHRYVKHLLSEGKIDKILESSDFYHFFAGEFDFHQFKRTFPDGVGEISGTEEYIPQQTDEKFSMDDYKKCLLKLIDEIPM